MAHRLFKHTKRNAIKYGIEVNYSPQRNYGVFLVTSALGILPFPLSLLSFLMFIPLFKVQKLMKLINEKNGYCSITSKGFKKTDIIFILLLLFFISVIILFVQVQ